MKPYQEQFIQFALACDVLRFGEFTLKSGRISPYFFNTGLFNTGDRLRKLGQFYAQAIQDSGVAFDTLFGPAYKGIPLVCAVGIGLSEVAARDVPYVFNRKEAKDHGEGGILVGAELTGKVLIVDDVISAGTSVRESVEIINKSGAKTAGVMISLNRQERGNGSVSAIQEVEAEFGFPVHSIISLNDIMAFISEQPGLKPHLPAIESYRAKFGTD